MLDFVVGRGGEVNAAASDGSTPLHWAARSGHGPLVRSLLAARAEPSLKDAAGLTPLQLATAVARGGSAREPLLSAASNGHSPASSSGVVDETRPTGTVAA